MFICQFFNKNTNFEATSVMSRVQVNHENNNPRDTSHYFVCRSIRKPAHSIYTL